jgi:hypothetical protein
MSRHDQVLRNQKRRRRLEALAACGICWLSREGTVAVNVRQLRLLVWRCKSSINASFQMLGFGLVSAGTECAALIGKYLHVVHDDFQELRQWTVRKNPATDSDGCGCISPAPESPERGPEFRVGIEGKRATLTEYIQSPSDPLMESRAEFNAFDGPVAFPPGDMHFAMEELSYFRHQESGEQDIFLNYITEYTIIGGHVPVQPSPFNFDNSPVIVMTRPSQQCPARLSRKP